MGEDWRADDTVLDREVAVKILKREYADDPTFRARFEAEARHAASLVHPNVASVFDFGELEEEGSAGRPFLVMELVPGQPLSALLRGGEAMVPDRAADIVAQASDAVAAAHALGIVHRDVKPGNLLVTPDGTVKLTDFGIARAASGAASITQTGQIIGTPYYISPEQAEGQPASEASDIYALGVVLYECLAGRRPFDRDTPIQVALAHIREEVPPLGEHVPARLRAIVEKALAKDPEDRFAGAADLAVALRGGDVAGLGAAGAAAGAAAMGTDDTRILEVPVLDEPTRVGGPADPTDRDRPRRALPPWWPWAAAAAAVLVIVLTTVAFAGSSTQEPAVASPDDGASATPTPSKKPSAKPSRTPDSRIEVREDDYLGRKAKDVKKELEALGLDVEDEKIPATSEDQEKDTVASVSPNGLVEPGSTVTIEVWEDYKPPEEEDDGGDEKSDKGPEGHPGKGKGHD
jgi:serine/threonine-protein kinase